jgi:hypothetical protein
MAPSTKTYTRKPSPTQSTTGEGASPAQEKTSPAEGQAATPAAEVKEYRQIEGGAQYVPAPKPPTLIEILPAEYQTTRPPLLYRLSTVSEPSKPDGRIAQSRTYRAKAFSCGVFYKPISRCLVEWEDRQDREDR